MPETGTIKTQYTGIIPGIIACALAIFGLFTIGFVFIPLAAATALISTVIAIKNKNMGGIGIAALAWILTVTGFFFSPVLLALIGLGTTG